MPFDGSGNYTPAAAPNFPAIPATTIASGYYNNTINDIATALNNCLTRDGQGKPSGTINWNGQLLTGLSAGTVSAPSLSFNGDANTGIFSPAADRVAITVGGATTFETQATASYLTGDYYVSGSTFFSSDAQFYAVKSGSNPSINLDTSDSLTYNRAGNLFQFVVGGSSRFEVDGTGAIFPSNLSMFYIKSVGGNPTINLDTNDYFVFDRPGNNFQFFVGGSDVFQIDSTGAIFPGNLSQFYIKSVASNPYIGLDTNDYLTYDRATNSLQFAVGGTQYLSFNASGVNFANLTNALIGTSGGTTVILQADTGDSLTYDRTGNSWVFNIGASARLTIASSGLVTIASGLTVSAGTTTTQALSSTTGTFSSTLGVTGVASFTTTVNIATGTFSNFLVGNMPNSKRGVQFDTGGDYLSYDTASDYYEFKIGGTSVLQLSSLGLFAGVGGFEYGWRVRPLVSTAAATYDFLLSDQGKQVTGGAATAFSIPNQATVTFPDGAVLRGYRQAVGGTLVTQFPSTMVLANSGVKGTINMAAFGYFEAVHLGSGLWLVTGMGLS